MATNTPYGLVSQKRIYTYANGWQAEQVFCCPYNGSFTISGGTNVDGSYSGVDEFIVLNQEAFFQFSPDSQLLQVTSITDEPWMEDDIVLTAGMSQTRKVTFSYTVVYLGNNSLNYWPSNITKPSCMVGTTLKLKVKYAGQYLTIPPNGIQPASGNSAASPNTQATQFIALSEFEVEWDRVTNASDLDFSNYIGNVNSDTFMGCIPGTLLCEGAPQENTMILSTTTNPISWKTTVTLKQRKIYIPTPLMNAGTYGWNDWYNPKTQAWEALTLKSGNPPYTVTAFTGMFH